MRLMKNKNYYLAFCLFLFTCSSSTEMVEMIDEDGAKISYTRRTDNFGKQGLYTKWYKDGGKLEEAMYENDTLHGFRKMYYPNGKEQIIEHYDMGQFKGLWQSYFESGQLQLEGEYVNNSMEGVWKGYYESGELKEEVQFKNSEENGPFTEYHKNGKLKAEGQYLDGDNEHGLLKLYDESGELTKKMDCKRGVCRTIWTKEGGDVKPSGTS